VPGKGLCDPRMHVRRRQRRDERRAESVQVHDAAGVVLDVDDAHDPELGGVGRDVAVLDARDPRGEEIGDERARAGERRPREDARGGAVGLALLPLGDEGGEDAERSGND
jgi:hypothetical protein